MRRRSLSVLAWTGLILSVCLLIRSVAGWIVRRPIWAHSAGTVADATGTALLVAIGCLLGLWALRRHYSRKARQRQGRCLRCGYHLRATRDRCPECGKLPERIKQRHRIVRIPAGF